MKDYNIAYKNWKSCMFFKKKFLLEQGLYVFTTFDKISIKENIGFSWGVCAQQ